MPNVPGASADSPTKPMGQAPKEFNLHEGSRIGNYTIVSKLGAGGMGVVYKATDVNLPRLVAVKLITISGGSKHERMLKRFFQEAEICANLEHPNIVKIYNVGTFQNSPYIVMEYIEGVSFLEYLGQKDHSLDDKIRLLVKIADALHYAHSKSIIHRDVKPSNIMVRNDGDPVLMDFGIAKVLSGDRSLTVTGEIMGSPQYMSPEQAEGRKSGVDIRADVYGLGAVLYHILLNRPPVEDGTLMEMMYRLGSVMPEPPRTVSPDIPEFLEQICMTALEKQKENRYPSAAAFASKLRLFLEKKKHGYEKGFKRKLSLMQLKRYCQLHKILVGLFVGFLSFVTTIFLVLYLFSLEERSLKMAVSANTKYEEDEKAMKKDMQEQAARQEEARRSMEEGGKLYRDKKFEKAIPYLEKASAIFPENLELYRLLGDSCYKIIETEQLEKEPLHLAHVFCFWPEFLKKYRYLEKAIRAYSNLVELQPWEWLWRYRRGICYSMVLQFQKAELDFVKCIKLKPEDTDSYIKVLDCIFYQGIANNYLKLMLFMQNSYQELRDIEPDLFKKEKDELVRSLTVYEKSWMEGEWNATKCQRFFELITASQSPEAQIMAKEFLLKMPNAPETYNMIQKNMKTIQTPAEFKKAKAFLRQLMECNILHIRQLLIRIYGRHDQDAWRPLYRSREFGVDTLFFLVRKQQENTIVRFWAACAIADMKKRKLHQRLLDIATGRIEDTDDLTQAPDALTQTLCQIAIIQVGDKSAKTKLFFQADVSDEYIMAMEARYAPLRMKELFARFLKDKNLRVRLLASSQLRGSRNLDAERELTQAMNNPEPVVQAFCIYHYWGLGPRSSNYIEKAERAQEHVPKLLALTESSDALVREIALLALAQMNLEEYAKVYQKFIYDPAHLVRLRALTLLTQTKQLSTVIPIVKDPKESLALRGGILAGMSHRMEEIKEAWLDVFLSLSKDPNAKLRVTVFHMMGILNLPYVNNQLVHGSRSKDEAVKTGCILGMRVSAQKQFLLRLRELTLDKSENIRFLARWAEILVLSRSDFSQLIDLMKSSEEWTPEIKKSRSLGYAGVLDYLARAHANIGWDWEKFYIAYSKDLFDYLYKLPWNSNASPKNRPVSSLQDYKMCLKYAQELDPENSDIQFEYGLICYIASTRNLDKAKYLKESIECFERALEKNPGKNVIKLYLIEAYRANNDYAKALAIIEQLLPEFPFDFQLLKKKAQNLRDMIKLQEAQEIEEDILFLKEISLKE